MAQMTQQEMHIALCEWMGWKNLGYGWESPKGSIGFAKTCHDLPPLTLDWLHECEMKLDTCQFIDYCILLKEAVHGDHAAIHATKEQRLEALCRTLFPERFKG